MFATVLRRAASAVMPPPLRASLVLRSAYSTSSGGGFAVPSAAAKNVRAITMDDVLPLEQYKERRPALRAWRTQMKAPRRIEVGPYVGILFTNYDLMWMQVRTRAHACAQKSESSGCPEEDTSSDGRCCVLG